MAVTRCVCHRRTFADLLLQARAQGWTSLEQLAAATGCGTGCGSCRPYVQQALATGVTAFEVAVPGEKPRRCRLEEWEPV